MKTLISIPRSIFGLALALSSLIGCTTVNTVERAEPVAPRQMVADKRIITDASLNRRAGVVGVNESLLPGGYLRVQFEVLNHTRSLQRFSYRVEWFDASGTLINTSASSSNQREIQGKASLFLTAVAPTPSAKDFRITLIEQ